MLSEKELDNYFEQHRLQESAREYIRQTRENPSRLVGTDARTNVVSGHTSAKGGALIQTESRTAEHACALEHEFSSDVLEFWDQPPSIDVVRTSPKGKQLSGYYTPEFVVLEVTGPCVEEVKTQEEIEELLRAKPADWVKIEPGVTYRPALEAYKRVGLAYRVVSSAAFAPIRTDNLKLLLRSRRVLPVVTDKLRDAIESALSEQPWMRLSALGERVGITDLTPLLQLIDQGLLYTLLSEELLAQPDSTWIAKSPAMLAMRKELSPDRLGYRAPDGNELRVSITDVPSGKCASRAVSNMERMNAGEKGRSIRRWNKKIRLTAKKEEKPNVFFAMLPNWDNCGNRKPRLCKAQLDFIKTFIKEHYATETRLSISRAHKLYKNHAKEAHPLLPAVSRPTLERYIALEDAKKIGEGRGGRRVANAAAEPSPVGKRQLLATRPFQMGAMDHYETDIHCILASRNRAHYTARPYLTLLIDVETDYVYSIWLSFRAPSRRACAMVIRLCVRKHGRLPEEILVDRGPEFGSVYFSALLGHCEVGPVWRPAEHPRFGSQAERFFLDFKTQWLSMRPGNLANYKDARAVSRSHAPPNLAKLTIEQLLSELLAFCEWRNTNRVNLSNLSPADQVAKGLQTFSCSGVPVTDDRTFMIASAVDVTDYALDPARGLHIGELHYWHPDLHKLAAVGRVQEVRMEPEDPYRVYAKVDSEWVTCLATGAQQFGAKDPVLRLAEAIRIHDGATARLEAKADADQLLITTMREFDAKWAAEAATALGPTQTNAPQISADSVFKKIRGKSIDPLKTSTWEKS